MVYELKGNNPKIKSTFCHLGCYAAQGRVTPLIRQPGAFCQNQVPLKPKDVAMTALTCRIILDF